MPYIVFFFVVVLPVALWIWFIRQEDRSEPEPGRLMRRCFYVGLIGAIVAGIFQLVLFEWLGLPHSFEALSNEATSFALVTVVMFLMGPIEELTKYLALRGAVYFNHEFNQVFDGIVYGITIGLGFSFIENVFYFIEVYTTESTGVFLAITAFRGLFSTLVHVTCAGIMGYFVGKAKFSNNNRAFLIAQGVVYASVLHILFNWILVSSLPYKGLLAIVLITGSFFIFMRMWKRPDVRMVWKYVPSPSPVQTNTQE